jgi:hypothetical protein
MITIWLQNESTYTHTFLAGNAASWPIQYYTVYRHKHIHTHSLTHSLTHTHTHTHQKYTHESFMALRTEGSHRNWKSNKFLHKIKRTDQYILYEMWTYFRRIRQIAKSGYYLLHVCPSIRLSVLMEQLCSHWTNFYETWHLSIFVVEKIQSPFKSDRVAGTLHKDKYTFLIISRSVLLRMKNVSVRNYKDQNTHFMFTIFFSRAVPCMRLCGKYGAYSQAKDGIKIMCKRLICWIIKTTNTHSDYVIVVYFSREKWFCERASVLLYTFV